MSCYQFGLDIEVSPDGFPDFSRPGRPVSPWVAEKLPDLPLGVSALVLDTDVVLLSDPFLHLRHDADFEVRDISSW